MEDRAKDGQGGAARERRPAARGDLPPRAGVWSAEPRPVRRTSKKVPGWWMLPLVPWSLSLGGQAVVGHVTPEWMVGLGIAALLLRVALELRWQIGEAIALRALRRDREFSDAPPDIEEFPMEIVLYDAGAYVGADRGFVWFEDGLLTFNGAACSFVIAAGDVYPRRKVDGRDFYLGLPSDALRLRTFGRAAYVRFLPLRGGRGLRFNFTLGRFLASRATSDLPRQWPPLTPCGEAPKEETRALGTAAEVGREAAREGIARGVVRGDA